jgi:SPX domain protein involved in polyphosphate accumulation
MANKLPATYFRRYEQKYRLNRPQYEALSAFLSRIVKEDQYGKSSVRTIYYDTDDFKIISRCQNKSPYKEKLRLRAYGNPGPDDKVFLELKKKYKGITYKRRIPVALGRDGDYSGLETVASGSVYVINEIKCFIRRFGRPVPRILIGCERIALQGIEDPSLRITFDTNLIWRDRDFDFSKALYGEPLLGEDEYLMELKVNETVPLSISRTLSRLGIYPVSFSKYSEAYNAKLRNQTVPN